MMYSSSAPGSLMLFGEHAVLRGRHAVCCAVDQRIRVELTPREDREIHVHSDRLGICRMTLDTFRIQAPFEFVLTAIEPYLSELPSGFDLVIRAEFAATMGLGSSSAVTVATIGAFAQWLNILLPPLDLFEEAKAVIVKVQGMGSGADAAAAVFGGVIAYRMQPLKIQPLSVIPDITLVYSGAKTPTKIVVKSVDDQCRADRSRYEALFDEIEQCTQAAIDVIKKEDWRAVGKLMNQHHVLQEALGVSTPLLNELAVGLCEEEQIYGAKISGSGLGDCVVALGVLQENRFPKNELQKNAGVRQIPVKISALGYRHEKI